MKLYCESKNCQYNKEGICDKPFVRSRLKRCWWYRKPVKKGKE